MAINKNLLLPSAASSSAIVAKTIKTSALSSVKSFKSDVSNLKDNKSSLRDLLVSINEKVIKIDKILKKTTKLQSKDYQRKLRDQRTERNQERERKLEEKKKEDKKQKPDEKKLPGLGFLDRIKRFLFFTFLGWLTNKYWDKIPAILEFTKKLTPIIGVIETIGGAIFNGVVNFIDTGYKVYDGLRDFTKQIGGEDFQKKFDDFSKNLNTFINIAIIAGMASMGGTDFGIGGKPRGGRTTGIRGSRNLPGRSRYGASSNAARRYAERYGRDAAVRRFGEKGVKSLGGKYARSQFSNLARKGIVNTLGKGGTKAALKVIRPLVKRLPFIGAFVDFALSVALGEPLGRAAFKSIGAGLLGAIGTGFGGPLGAIIGGFAGDWAGGKLYDIFFGGQQNVDDKSKPKKKARGGVTRGGKEVSGSITRSLRTTRKYEKFIIPPNSGTIIPGNSIGGEDEIKTLFPEPSENQLKTHQNPFGFIFNSTQKMGDVPYLGPLFSLFGKLILGQSPSSSDYRIIALNLNAWINNAIVNGQLNGANTLELLKSMTSWVQVSVKQLVSGVTNEIIADLNKMLRLTSILVSEFTPSMGAGADGELARGTVPGGKLSIEQLVGLAKGAGFSDNEAVIMAAIAMAESGGNSNAKNFKPPDKSYGLWQVNMIGNLGPARLQEFGLSSESELFDPVVNAHAAYKIRKSSGLSSWTVYKTGKYKNYLGQARKAANAPKITVYKPTTETLGDIDSGTGGVMQKSSRGTKLAGDLGRFLKSAGVGSWGSGVSEHPDFGGSFKRGYASWHNVDRAIDVGGYWPQDQVQILKKIDEFNKRNNVRPVELLYGKPGTPKSSSHGDHVHVAYKDGGVVGPNKPKNVKPIESQASYEDGYTILIQPIIIEKPVPVGKKTINFSGGGSVNTNNDKSSLFIR